MNQKSVIEWTKYAAAALPLIGMSVAIALFARDIRNSIADIRKEQVEIRRTQANIVRAVENGNDRIVSEVHHSANMMAVELGRVSERTQ